MLLLPAASWKLPAATVMLAGELLDPDCVKLAVYKMPEPVKLVKVPPATATSELAKSVAVSDKLKVKVTTSRLLNKLLLLVMDRLGTMVSIDKLTAFEVKLLLPAASVKRVAATLTLALVVELGSGVKTAV